MSAARKRRCSRASKASAASCAPSRRCRLTRACSAARPSSTTCCRSRRCPFILAKGAKSYFDFGMGRSRGTMPIQLAGNIKYGGLFETAFGITLGELVDDIGGGTRLRPAGQGGAGRRPARRLLPARAVRHAVRLRGVRRAGRPDRPRRRRRVRRHRRHGQAGALCVRVLRHRELRQVHALPHRLDARRRDHRQGHGRRRTGPTTSRSSRISATR